MLTIQIAAARYVDAIEVDKTVYKIARRAQRAWAWLLFAAFADFFALLLIPRHDFAILAPIVVWWAGSLVALVIAAFVARVAIERKQLPAVVAKAVAFYKLPNRDMHPGVLRHWHELLTEAGVTKLPEGQNIWLDGPHATWLCVLGAGLDAFDSTGSEWTRDRALGKLRDAALVFAEDTRWVTKCTERLNDAKTRLNHHFGS